MPALDTGHHMTSVADLGVKRRLITVEAYHRMGEAGILAPDERVELIEGQIVEMAPIGSRHSGMVTRLNRLLVQAAGDRGLVSVQNPVWLSRITEPQPDFTLLKPRADDYQSATPRPEDVLLVVEIAETSVRYDREIKVPLFAAHAIPELWIVDVGERVLWTYRELRAGAYAKIEKTDRPGRLRLSAAPEIEIDLSGLFA
jgi:Uma2 family endonuclease